MAIAVDLVQLAQRGEYDVGIVCSADSDLAPAIEAVLDDTTSVVEVASWRRASYGQRIFIPGRDLFCHWLYQDNYHAVRDETDYNARA